MVRHSSIVKAEAKKIFNKLEQEKGYRSGFASIKVHMITQLLNIKQELCAFAQTIGCDHYKINGFLMEQLAHFSSQLPKNTLKAQAISETIIDYLDKHRLSNPDHLWLKITGKRITLTGIGEVKSHLISLRHRPKQLAYQEFNITNIMEHNDLTSLFSKRYRITQAETLIRYLILPRSIDTPYTLPASAPLGWEVKEIEFTFPEIMFLKYTLLGDILPKPYVCKDFYCPEIYRLFIDDMIRKTKELSREFYENLIYDEEEFTLNALAFWMLLYESVPTGHESINSMISWLHTLEKNNISILSLLLTPPSRLNGLNKNEHASLDSITKFYGSDMLTISHAFLSRLQEMREELPVPPKLPKKQSLNIFALL